MRKSWFGILVIAFLLFALAMKCGRKRAVPSHPAVEESESPAVTELNEVAYPTPAAKAKPMPSPPAMATPILAPSPPPHAQASPKEEFNPYRVDRFTLRKLDLPLPTSINELLANLTEFKEPKLPVVLPGQDGDFDGEIVMGEVRGYIEEDRGALRRIQARRTTGGIELAIEKTPGKFQKLSDREPGLKLNNFNGDPYSLVMTLSDGRVLYLKFRSRIAFADVDHQVRAFTGWTLSSSQPGSKVGFRTALVGDLGDRFWGPDPVEPEEGEWPSVGGIKAIMPKEPLAR
jgi:hypothetical protein